MNGLELGAKVARSPNVELYESNFFWTPPIIERHCCRKNWHTDCACVKWTNFFLFTNWLSFYALLITSWCRLITLFSLIKIILIFFFKKADEQIYPKTKTSEIEKKQNLFRLLLSKKKMKKQKLLINCKLINLIVIAI